MGRRYAPLLVLVVVQLVLASLVPSVTGHGSNDLAVGGTGAGAAGGSGASAGGVGGAATSSAAGPAASAGSSTGAAGVSAGASSSAGPSATAAGSGGGAAAQGRGGGSGPVPPGGPGGIGYSSTDRSKCAPNGREIGPTAYMPPCVPVWHGGNNGGSTMTGVTGNQVRFVYYAAGSNTQVNAIEGYNSNSAETFCLTLQAFTNEINKRFELYGRHLVSVDGPGSNSGAGKQSPCHFPYFQSQCSLTPPDPACDRAEADVIASLKPAFVVAPVAHDTLMERLAQDHIIMVGAAGGGQGGDYLPQEYFSQLSPYYYNVFPNGTELMANDAQFYCAKLSGRPVQFAGPDVLHPAGSNPLAPPPTRKVAIVFPENNGDPSIKVSADIFVKDVTGGMCGSAANGTQEFSYASNITTAQQQSTTLVAGLKQAGITTVLCFCDSLAPIFISEAMDSQGYHPEILLPGGGLLDNDTSAQLYDPNVWKYAFGPSEIGDAQPIADTDAQKAWIDGGGSGTAGNTSPLILPYFEFMGNAVQLAGPDLTPARILAGLDSAPPEGGGPYNPTVEYRPPYPDNGIIDFREVYYCPTQKSADNNQPGAYEPVAGGKRTVLGHWPGGTSELFPGGPCA